MLVQPERPLAVIVHFPPFFPHYGLEHFPEDLWKSVSLVCYASHNGCHVSFCLVSKEAELGLHRLFFPPYSF